MVAQLCPALRDQSQRVDGGERWKGSWVSGTRTCGETLYCFSAGYTVMPIRSMCSRNGRNLIR